MRKNTPYVKVYENGIVTNPITKENPFISGSSLKSGKRVRKSNNRKGVGLVVARIGVLTFAKYKTVKQQIENKLIINSVLVN